MKFYKRLFLLLTYYLYFAHAGYVALSRNGMTNTPSQAYLSNQTRDDDVDVKVEVNVSGRNSTTVSAPKIRTDKEVLQKILHNPTSKEHVKAVKILRALVKHLKTQNNTKALNSTSQGIDTTPKTNADAETASKVNPETTSENNSELTSVQSQENNPTIPTNVASSHAGNSFSSKSKQGKKKISKKKKKKSRKVNRRKLKPKKHLKQTKRLKKVRASNEKMDMSKEKNDLSNEKINVSSTTQSNNTEPMKHIKGLFTETLKQAIIESTVKALRKAYHNRTSAENLPSNNNQVTNSTSNESEKTAMSESETSSLVGKSVNESKSEPSETSNTESTSNINSFNSNDTTSRGAPLYETTNVNIPAVNNGTRVVTNIYKIIIHKNDSKEIQPQASDDISQQNKDTKIESFTKISNNSESGSAGNPDDYDDENEEDEEEDDTNANINRNKPSSMSDKTLTITFQENAASLGGSSKIEKEPVLPGSSRLNLKINQNDESVTSSRQITDHETTPLIDETLKTDAINITEGIIHESNTARPQKLFNDSLFEEAGMKANDKKQGRNAEDIVSEKTNKKSFALRPILSDKTSKIASGISIGEEIDGGSLDMSGSGAGSAGIGEELFFSKNERLSDVAEIDTPIPADDDKQMKEKRAIISKPAGRKKRDIITASVKTFANNLLNHKLFIRKHPVNRVSVSDRGRPYKKHHILDKSNRRHVRTFTRLHPQKLISAPAEKRNELKLHKVDRKNISLEDMSWNGEAVRYGSLVFKRNIVSEDDEPQMDTDQSVERFHKEMILVNHGPPVVETSDKIFHRLPPVYNRRNEIPSREKLVAKREVTKKHNFIKKNKNLHSYSKSTISREKRKNKKGISRGHQERGDKRLNIPVEVIGNEGETVDDLYKFGTEASIHTTPIFSDNLDPFTQALAEREKLSISKPVRPNVPTPLSVFDTPIITGGTNVPQTQPGPSPVTQEDEREAGQELLSYKNNLNDDKLRPGDNFDGVPSNVNPMEIQSSEIASNSPNLQPDMSQPHGEAQMNEEVGVTEMESNADPTAISPEMNQLENQIEQPVVEKPVSPGGADAGASIKAKEEASKAAERLQVQETMFAEKKLREMELARAQLEIKARDRENAEAEKSHMLQRQAIHSTSAKKNATSVKPQAKANNLKQAAKFSKPKVTVQMLPASNKKKGNTQLKANTTKPIVLTGKIETNKSLFKNLSLSNHTPETIKVKTIFPPAWHLKVTKENAIGAPDADLVLSKRHQTKTRSMKTKRDIESQEMNEKKTDLNESDKVVATEADIPGVFAEKTDRKINRDFGGDNVDTETIVDDVRKRTPKLKNDVLIDEGLDTAKRHDVKKSVKLTRKSAKDTVGNGFEKNQKYETPDSDIEYIKHEEMQANLHADGTVRKMDKNGYISNTQIIDSETPNTKNDNNDFTSETTKKLDAELNSEY